MNNVVTKLKLVKRKNPDSPNTKESLGFQMTVSCYDSAPDVQLIFIVATLLILQLVTSIEARIMVIADV